MELSLLFVKGDEEKQNSTKTSELKNFFCFQKESFQIAFIIGFLTTICLFLPLKLFYRLILGMLFSFLICAFLARYYEKYSRLGFQRLWLISLGMSSLVGSMNAFFHNFFAKENSIFFIIFSYMGTLFLKFMIKKYVCIRKRLLYPVILENRGETMKVMAFLDTGNGLMEPFSKKPVSIVGKDMLEQIKADGSRLKLIPYRSMGKKKGILYAYEIDAIIIETELKKLKVEKPVIAVGDMKIHEKNKYEMILHPMLVK